MSRHQQFRSLTSGPSLSPSTQSILSAAVLAALAIAVPAQVQFDELTRKELPADADNSRAIAAGDVDGDGDVDLIVANAGQNRLYLNDGTGAYADATASNMPVDSDSSTAVVVGDVNGDNHIDIIFGNSGGAGPQTRLYLNDGTGAFTDATASNLPADTDATLSLAMGDVDDDGDLDLFVGNDNVANKYGMATSQSRLFINDGFGVFTDETAARLSSLARSTKAVFGDVDGDDHIDLVLGNQSFVPSPPPPGKYPGIGSQSNQIYINDGNGVFVDETGARLTSSGATSAIALGDVDGDDDLDLVVCNDTYNTPPMGPGKYPTVIPPVNQLFLNDGTGVFSDVTAAQLPMTIDAPKDVAVGDLDGDDDVDIFVADVASNRVYINDGTGTFTDESANRLASTVGATTAAQLVDVDSDNDLDQVIANNGQNRLNFNLLLQLHAPLPLQINQTYTIEAYARFGPPSAIDLAVPAASFGTASVPVPPFGILGLDPTQLSILPAITIPQPQGVGAFNIAIGNIPSLIGVNVFLQALYVPLPLPLERFTNVEGDQLQ